MKRAVIVVLVCVNVALLLTLMLGPTAPKKADAQVFGGASNYIVVTGKIGKDDEAVYVVDVARQQMLAWRFDDGNEKFHRFRGRELKKDFRVKN